MHSNRRTNFFDAFSGASSVAYYFKAKGKQVISNDFLKFNYHISKAIVENKNVILSRNDIDILLQYNKNAKALIDREFTGVFFESNQAKFLDNFRANINLCSNPSKIEVISPHRIGLQKEAEKNG